MGERYKLKIGTGVTSIFMIFIILCLTAFGVLSFSASKADNKLSKKNAAYIESYYEKEGEIIRKIAEIDAKLSKVKNNAVDKESYDVGLGAVVSEYENMKFDTNSRLLTGSISLDNRQNLNFSVSINEFKSDLRLGEISFKIELKPGKYKGEIGAY